MRFLHFIFVLLAAGVQVVNAGPFGGDDTGVSGNSPAFKGWITGYRNYIHPANSGGYSFNDDLIMVTPSNAILGRPAGFSTNDADAKGHILSLGNGGTITLEFEFPVADGPGPDFAVFENAFRDETRFDTTNPVTFAELAFVEVATTTNAWARFPVTYFGTQELYSLNNQSYGWYASQDVTLIDGLAGKHATSCGTPFDLSVLSTHSNVANGSVVLDHIRFIRLTDVVGDGSTYDDNGRPIFDPYYHPTQGYPVSGPAGWQDGFDLRAVGIIHFAGVTMTRHGGVPMLTWYGEEGTRYEPEYRQDDNWNGWGVQIDGTNGWAHAPLPPAGEAALFRIRKVAP